ncbi:hypothetical protein FB45DRAFT_1113961 [Roridomyces roridus]|uniref:DUF6534 domain-containing protein n=1 Tax=Roridomyces roridus TaxID=1738132 RepID=A0AAD7CB04_9AGAR|nr:hypothetical protein FB45DRAFT_1113961 [Roridomyces roridus]
MSQFLALPLGALTVQLYFYCQAFPKDKPFVKGLVYAAYCIILSAEIIDLDCYFDIFGYGFADISGLIKDRLNWIVGPITAGLLGLVTQTFYAHRMHVLSGNHRAVPSVVLAHCGLYCPFGVDRSSCGSAESILSLQSRRFTIIGGLTKANTGFRRTHALVSKLIWLILGTGSLSALMALTSLALYLALPGKLYYQAPGGVLPYLHANSRIQNSGGRGDELVMMNSNVRFAGPPSSHINTATTNMEMKEMEGVQTNKHIVLGRMPVGLDSSGSEASKAEQASVFTRTIQFMFLYTPLTCRNGSGSGKLCTTVLIRTLSKPRLAFAGFSINCRHQGATNGYFFPLLLVPEAQFVCPPQNSHRRGASGLSAKAGRPNPPGKLLKMSRLPDLTGQIFLVTGGNVGIGKETCRVAPDSAKRAREAIKEICESTGKTDIHFLQLDLADLAAVRKAAEEYLLKEQELHVLINNAGVLYAPGIGPETAQGYDAQFGIHVLGHYFFTKLLMPVLLRTAKGEVSGKPQRVRIVTVSSDAHESTAPKKGIVWDSLQQGDEGFFAAMVHSYANGKGNVLISCELARRYGEQGVVAISLHPGGVDSQLLRHLYPIIAWIVTKMLIYPVSLGVITSLYAATSEAALEMNGGVPNLLGPSAGSKYLSVRRARSWRRWCEDQVDGYQLDLQGCLRWEVSRIAMRYLQVPPCQRATDHETREKQSWESRSYFEWMQAVIGSSLPAQWHKPLPAVIPCITGGAMAEQDLLMTKVGINLEYSPLKALSRWSPSQARLPLSSSMSWNYFYHQAFPKDKPFVKGLVYALYCVILFSAIVDLDSFFNIFGPGFGDISGLTKIRLNWIVGAIGAGLLALASQMFYAHRIYILSDGNRILPGLVLAISLASAAGSFTVAALIAQADSELALRSPRSTAAAGVHLAGTAACDILIAVCMTYYLTKADVGFRRTRALISKLVALIIGTGSLTGTIHAGLALTALISLTLYLALPEKLYYQAPSGLLPYLHANSVLVILNSRLQLPRGRVDEVSGGITISNLQFAGPASNGTNTAPPSTVTNGARVLSTAVATAELDEMKEMEGAASRHVVLSRQMGLNLGSSWTLLDWDSDCNFPDLTEDKVANGSSSVLHTPPAVTYTNLGLGTVTVPYGIRLRNTETVPCRGPW